MKKKFKAFSAPPFVLKAVMAGQVCESHCLSIIVICSVKVGLRDWCVDMSRHVIEFCYLQIWISKTHASGVQNGRHNHTAWVLLNYS